MWCDEGGSGILLRIPFMDAGAAKTCSICFTADNAY